MKILPLILTLFIPWLVSYGQQTRADKLRELLLDGGKSNYVMVFAHRGDWRSAPENSLNAFRRCIDMDADGIEVDVQLTKDSVLICMHDDTLDRTTTGHGAVADYCWSDLQKLWLKTPIGVVTRQKIPTFEEVLRLCKGKILIQVDKWTKVLDLVISAAQRNNCLNQIILRSSMCPQKFRARYGNIPNDIIYIPVIVCDGTEHDTMRLMADAEESKIISLSFKSDNLPIIDKINCSKNEGYRIWFNSLWATFNGGHDDELALYDPENAYGWLLSHGANIIFTDHPSLLLNYLNRNNLHKTI